MIKSADKGNAFVVCIKSNHLMEASSQLKDTTVYQKCQSTPLHKITKETEIYAKPYRDW